MIRTAIVLVNYYKEEELIQFVNHFLVPQLTKERKILVVDNGSHGSLLTEEFESNYHVTVLNPKSNLGYFGAARYAYDYLKEKSKIPDNFIVSNFDLSLDAKIFLDTMEEKVNNISAAVIGPNIKSSLSGAALNPMYRERIGKRKINLLIFITSFYILYFFYQCLHHIKRKLFVAKRPSPNAGYVYSVHGSFMIFKRSYFESGGHLNFSSFLYGEEIFTAEECRRLSLKIYFDNTINVEHSEHTTTGNFKNRQHTKWLNQSLRYLRKAYYERS